MTDRAEIETRVEAVLSVDVTGGGKEAPVDLSSNLDQRLYQEAIRRKTGSESARAAEPASRRPTSKCRRPSSRPLSIRQPWRCPHGATF